MERTETPVLWRKPPVTEIPVPVVAAPAPYSAVCGTSSTACPKTTKSLLRAAWKLDAQQGMAKLEKLAQWLEREHPDAADSLREGMEECFTINRLDVPPSLHRCLARTNVIENPHSGVRRRTRRVCRWRDKPMAKRWAAAALLATEKNFRRVMGHKDLWALQAILDGKNEKRLDRGEKVA